MTLGKEKRENNPSISFGNKQGFDGGAAKYYAQAEGESLVASLMAKMLFQPDISELICAQNSTLKKPSETAGELHKDALSQIREKYLSEFVTILREESTRIFPSEDDCEQAIAETRALIAHFTQPDHLRKTLDDQGVKSVFLFHPRQILTSALAGVIEEKDIIKKVNALKGSTRVQFGDEAAIFSVVNTISNSKSISTESKRRLLDLATLLVNTLPAFVAGIGELGSVKVALVCIPINLEQAFINKRVHPRSPTSFYTAAYNTRLVKDTLAQIIEANGGLTLGLGAMTPGMIRKNDEIMEYLENQEQPPKFVDGHAGTVALMIMNIEAQLNHNKLINLHPQEVTSIGVVGVGQIGSLFIRSYLKFLRENNRSLPATVYLNDVKKKHRRRMLKELKTEFPDIKFEVASVKKVMSEADVVVAATNQRQPYTVIARNGQILLDDGQPNAWQSKEGRNDVIWPTGGLIEYERMGVHVFKEEEDGDIHYVVRYSTVFPYDWGSLRTALRSLSSDHRVPGMFGCELQDLTLTLALNNHQFVDDPAENNLLCQRITKVMQSDATESTTVEQVLETLKIFEQIGIRVNPMLSRVV